MKNNLKIFLTTSAFAVICALAANNFAQVKTGGYKKVAKTDAGVVAAAEFAVKDVSKKKSTEVTLQLVETAERQTVAGTNYKLCIEIFRIDDFDDAEVKEFVQTVIFRSLKNQMTLKSWTKVENCGEQK
ncbi:MAG: hypothetical protein LH472_04670 [Pyrinomonadaceae bacterium]|nr:hypothetical protein [Pyrinomonadaceae bacterium]